MTTTPLATPSLPLVPSDEERQMRETVAAICKSFGPHYTRDKVAANEPPTELWDALASRGYLGINLPEEYGGGGLGIWKNFQHLELLIQLEKRKSIKMQLIL